GGGLGEPDRIVEGQIPVHLVGGHVVQSHPVAAHRLEQGERADQVGVDERGRVGQRVVVVRLGGEMHHRVDARDQLVDQLGVGHVADDELGAAAGQRGAVAGVGELVEHRDVDLGPQAPGQVHEVRADEAGAAGDQYA